MACRIAGRVGCGGGAGTFFLTRGFQTAALEEGGGDHGHEGVSVQALP
jgi:hypothetical protein